MSCCSFPTQNVKYIKTHYIGKSGKEYPYDDYCNWGTGKSERGKQDLPLDDYPYKIRYQSMSKPEFCNICNKFKEPTN